MSHKRHHTKHRVEDDQPNSAEDAFARGADDRALQSPDLKSDAPPAPTEQGDGAPATSETSDVSDAAGAEREKYLRLAAEYDNYRKRSVKERQDAESRGQAELVKQLIDPLDDIARFAHVDPASTEAATIVQGVDMVEKKLLKMLSAAGLEIINPVDQSFDPALHEAVMTEPAAAQEDDHVVSRVFQPGYLFKGQLLRPARVVVKQWNG
jgi:molecular chaperone GrpE